MDTVLGFSNPPLEDVLEHYGVKGMRWGVRRSQAELDRAAGRTQKREQKRKRRTDLLEGRYRARGKEASVAKRKAENRVKAERVLKVVGTVAVASLAAYTVQNEIGKRFTDVVLEKDTTLKNVNVLGKKQELDRRLYVTYKERDSKKYRGMYATTLQKHYGKSKKVFETSLRATEQIKAPSHREAKKLYAAFQKEFAGAKIGPLRKDKLIAEYIKTTKNYNQFNRDLVNQDSSHPFFKFLQKHGYNAVLDTNDQFMSGYNTQKPLILFNAASSVVKAGEKAIDHSTMNKLYVRQLTAVTSTQLAPTIGLGVAAVTAGNKVNNRNKHEVVNNYILNHPRGDRLDPARVYSKLERSRINGKWTIKE